jgi:hypothetical protein
MSILLAEYRPSKGGVNHQIVMGNDSVTYCTCTGWKMRKNCKHLLDWTLQGGAMAAVKHTSTQEQLMRDGATVTSVFDDDTKMNDAINMATQMLKG